MPPWWLIASLGLAAVLVTAAVLLVVGSGGGAVTVVGDSVGDIGAVVAESGTPARGAPSADADVVVDVQGAVLRPGIVRLPPGSRVADAIAAAGGFGPRVAAERVGHLLNLAAVVRDGDQVIVPSRDDASAAAGGQPAGAAPSGGLSQPHPAGPIDLNTATATELDALPGVGPVTAAKIIAAREEQPFASVDDLRTRKVVGAATLEKIKDLVVVR
jgi:competence protein ComEA